MTSAVNKKGDNKVNILGVYVSGTELAEVLRKIDEKVNSGTKPFFIITVYSESLLEKSPEFKKALTVADLVVADGVSVAASIDYLGNNISALQAAINILQNKYLNRPSGIKILKSILSSGKYRVYLSGGFNEVADRLAHKYNNVVGWDNGDKNMTKINATHPDILFVALGRFKQEIWISQNLGNLQAKVIIGVGSAFDEVAENWQVPAWVNEMGLKWLWRITRDPKHIVRAFQAFPVFPLKVWWWNNHPELL